MAMLHSNIDRSSDKPNALAFGINNAAASHAVKHAGIKIASLVFVLAVILLFMIAGGVSGHPASTQLNSTPTAGSPNAQNDPAPNAAASAQSDTSSSVTVNASNGNTSKSSVKVTVNGQDVPVPANGKVQKTVTTSGGTTTFSINTSTQGSGGNDSTSSTSLNVLNNSTTFGNNDSNTYTDGEPMD